MGCSECQKKPQRQTECSLPPVLQINSEECPILFHTVEVDTTAADDPPLIGRFKNVLLLYKGDGAKYLYNSDGIPTNISQIHEIGPVTDFNKLDNRPLYGGVRMTSETDIPDVVSTVSAAVAVEKGEREETDTNLSDAISQEIQNRSTADTTITGYVNRDFVDDFSMEADASSITLVGEKLNPVTGSTTTIRNMFPEASASAAGTISAAEYAAIKDSQNRLDALENGAVAITGLSADPTQGEITAAWQTATGLATVINRASVYDVTNSKVWTYYSNDSTWYASSNTPQVVINPFTNTSAGIIKGSTIAGNVSANADGTGTVAGWTELNNTVAGKANSNDLATVATTGSYTDLTNQPNLMTITMSTTDIGEGVPLAENTLYGVYN